VPPTHSPDSPLSPPSGVAIGLGSNLGDRALAIGQAARELERRLGPLRASRLYASAPLGPEQPDFLNAAVLVDHPGPLLDLLAVCREIEGALGRARAERWGPRTIDLDLLWAGDRTSASAVLTVPHPELTKRAFALLPLLDLCPDATEPKTRMRYQALLPEVHSQRIEVVAGVDFWREPEHAQTSVDTRFPRW